MDKAITFFFDFISPYSYLAYKRLPKLAEQHGYAMRYRPIDLKTAKLSVGNVGPTTREMPVKHRHLRKDLQRWARLYGVTLSHPGAIPFGRANRGTFFAEDRNAVRAYLDLAWDLVWARGAQDEEALLAALADGMKWKRAEFLDYVASPAALARYQACQDEAQKLGVFGVPTMVIGEEMWWGNDRLHFLEDYLRTGTDILGRPAGVAA